MEVAVGWRDDVAMAQWLFQTMVAAVMAVILVNCAAAVDVTATIPSLALTAAAKTLLPLPPSTIAFIDDDCYCCR
jgi:hypothetical protein